MVSNAYLQVDLQTLKNNIEQIRREIGPGTKLIPVLKGNAYGLGAVRLAHYLDGLGGFDAFAVSHVSEGTELRQAGILQQILVMSLPLDFQVEEAVANNLVITLGSFHQFPVLQAAAKKAGKRIPVSLKADTGLHRIGFVPEETDQLIAALKETADCLDIRDTFSHFSDNSEEQISLQSARFQTFTEKLRSAGIDPGLCHMASSASLESGRDVLFDAVRIGRRLILDNPDNPTGKIREAVSFRAFLTDVRNRRAGDTLGYDRRVTLDRDTRIGVLSIGYGDGLDPALVRAKAPVLVNGVRASLCACCMDQSFVDLGDIPCEAGDEVTLFGYDRTGTLLPAQEIASLIGCEGCDLTARMTERVERVYCDGSSEELP